jgi:Holliday junction resolvasome RuvABC endonuclease subunit
MISCGLDLGRRRGGLVVLEPSRVEGYLAQCRFWLSLRNLKQAEFQETLELAILKHKVELVSTEKPLDFGWRKVYASQTGLADLVQSVCQKMGVKYCSYPPKTIKAALTGNGNASKEQMVRMINRAVWFNVPVTDEHVADAGAIGLLALQRKGKE